MNTKNYNLSKLKAHPRLEIGSEATRNWLYDEPKTERHNYFWIGFKDDPSSRVYQFVGWKRCVDFLEDLPEDHYKFWELKQIVESI